jgi:hypothetical protein
VKFLAFVRSRFLAVSLAGVCVLDVLVTSGCVVYPARPAVVVGPRPVVVGPRVVARPRAVVVRPAPVVVHPAPVVVRPRPVVVRRRWW